MVEAYTLKKYFLFVFWTLLFPIASDAQQLLDSIVKFSYVSVNDSARLDKKAYAYNDQGKEISYAWYHWDSTRNGWMGNYNYIFVDGAGKFDYQYDQTGQRISTVSYIWSRSLNEWVFSLKNESRYDEHGNEIQHMVSRWDTIQREWIFWNGREEGYDENGNQILKEIYLWDTDQNNWVPFRREEFEYDASNRKTRHLSLNWRSSAGDWIPSNKSQSDYDSFGNEILSIGYYWKKDFDTWAESTRTVKLTDGKGQVVRETFYLLSEPNERIEYQYDQSGNQILKTDLKWNLADSVWEGRTREESGFDQSGNQVVYAAYKWYPGINKWVGDNKTEWEFDQNGFKGLERHLTWSTEKNDWKASRKIVWERDLYGRTNVMTLWINSSINIWNCWYREEYYYLPNTDSLQQIIDYTDPYLASTSQLQLVGKTFYYYHPLSTGMDQQSPAPIKVFPNPTFGIINFANMGADTEVQILSLQGVLIRSFYSVASQIDVSSLPAGVYILKISEKYHSSFNTLFIKE